MSKHGLPQASAPLVRYGPKWRASAVAAGSHGSPAKRVGKSASRVRATRGVPPPAAAMRAICSVAGAPSGRKAGSWVKRADTRFVEATNRVVKQDVCVLEEPGRQYQGQRNAHQAGLGGKREKYREDNQHACCSATGRADEVMEDYETFFQNKCLEYVRFIGVIS